MQNNLFPFSLALTLSALLFAGCARNETATLAVAPAPAEVAALVAPAPTIAVKATARPTVATPPVSAKPTIISRQSWDAQPARKGMKPQSPRFITIHHTATKQSQKTSIEQKMRNLQNFSQHVVSSTAAKPNQRGPMFRIIFTSPPPAKSPKAAP